MQDYSFWLLVGTQYLYGEDTFVDINAHAQAIASALTSSKHVPCKVVAKPCLKNAAEITDVITQANADPACAGVITWMHTFSPSKMWIRGLSILSKPYLHINTQFNRDIPWDSIDMDFMNLNQSAHGDREHGYIAARMRLPRKVVAGHWEDELFQQKVGRWMRSAVGAIESRKLRVLRISDNMRNVAVTDGDKIEAQIKLGWQVDHYGVGDIIRMTEAVTESEIDAQMAEYEKYYTMDTDNIDAVRYQAREEVAIQKFMEQEGFGAFQTNFEDLQGLRQLPGLAAQDLMRQGYGFGAEGDWKIAALTRVMKLMAEGLDGGTAFMEDYTYHFEPGNEMLLGAHMLEVCPTIAAERPKIQVHPLGIGDREDPARLVFKSQPGSAIVTTLVDMGDRLRMIVNDVECKEQLHDMPKLPVAGVLWAPKPCLQTSAEAWIYAGGAHHSVLSYALTPDIMRDFAEITGIEFLHIDQNTDIESFCKELFYNDVAYKVGR
ncbi:MAG TPA: L-arabinose isomerase [Candidatus Scubalenecus merdavium]|uniref:L-arabinose isomerase n=1 Tax=Candidatus Scybalenecus merdavium TaxID=2840939 RepID=A0A9D1MTM3_9FIRM|nr:L-arabinose isomerase [Candidatus Scubalenecus merdavium]